MTTLLLASAASAGAVAYLVLKQKPLDATALTSNVSTLTNKIDAMDVTMKDNNTNLQNTNAGLNILNTNITTANQTIVDNLNSNFSALNQNLDTSIGNISNSLNSYNSNITNVTGKLDSTAIELKGAISDSTQNITSGMALVNNQMDTLKFVLNDSIVTPILNSNFQSFSSIQNISNEVDQILRMLGGNPPVVVSSKMFNIIFASGVGLTALYYLIYFLK